MCGEKGYASPCGGLCGEGPDGIGAMRTTPAFQQPRSQKLTTAPDCRIRGFSSRQPPFELIVIRFHLGSSGFWMVNEVLTVYEAHFDRTSGERLVKVLKSYRFRLYLGIGNRRASSIAKMRV